MANAKKALILGVTGQDGAHLAEHLLNEGWTVYGGFRRGGGSTLWRLNYLGITDRIKLVDIDVNEPYVLLDNLRDIKPDHIYHLAGESFVADSFFRSRSTMDTNVVGTLNVLDAVKHNVPDARVFFASSAEVFGSVTNSHLIDEKQECKPNTPYGISKLSSQHFVRIFRESHGLFASCGILFNHEGPLRARNFVTRKITFNVARLRVAGGEPMELGNLSSSRDWGASSDYTRAMKAILDLDQPQDFVVATGKLTTVREFLQMAAREAGFDPAFDNSNEYEMCYDAPSGMPLANVSPKYFRPHDTRPMAGNPAKLQEVTDWRASHDVGDLARAMVSADIERWKAGKIDV